MAQGHAGPQTVFVRLMQCIIADLDSVHMHFNDDATVFDCTPSHQIQSIQDFLGRLEERNLELTPEKANIFLAPIESPS